MISDFGQRVETVFGEQYLTARLLEKYLSAPPNGIAVVDDHHLDVAQLAQINQLKSPCLSFEGYSSASGKSYYGAVKIPPYQTRQSGHCMQDKPCLEKCLPTSCHANRISYQSKHYRRANPLDLQPRLAEILVQYKQQYQWMDSDKIRAALP